MSLEMDESTNDDPVARPIGALSDRADDNDLAHEAKSALRDQDDKAEELERSSRIVPLEIHRRSSGEDDDRRGRTCQTLRRKFKRMRVLCGRFVNNSRVQLTITTLIGVNAIFMGIGTFDFVTDDPVVEERFQTVDLVFLVVFTVELALQFFYHGVRLILDRWLLFDLVIIVTSWAFKKAQVMRAFRIFRALRLITRVETMRNLVKALFAASTSMAGIGLLLCLIMYIFSVVFTQLFKSLYEDGQTKFDYFSRLDASFFTSFQLMTLDNWGDLCREIMAVYWWAWMPIISYVIIAGFAAVNLIIAVICDAMSAMHEDDKAKIRGCAMKSEDGDDALHDGNEEEERDQREGEWADDSSANDSWEVQDVCEGSSSAKSEGNMQKSLMDLQGELKDTMRVQDQTIMAMEYLTRQLQKIPTPKS